MLLIIVDVFLERYTKYTYYTKMAEMLDFTAFFEKNRKMMRGYILYIESQILTKKMI